MARTRKPPAKRKPARAKTEPDVSKAPRYHRWLGPRSRESRTFDVVARARVVEALAAHGRIGLACALAGVSAPTVLAWRKRGAAQLRELDRHEAAQDRLAAADTGHQRQPYPGPLEAAGFLLEVERAAAWWEAQHQHRLQVAAEGGDHAITMWLLARHDRLTGKVKGEVHEHHHHQPPSAVDKLQEIVKRRKALRGGT